MNARNMRAVLSGIAVLTFASAAHAVPPSGEGASVIAINDGMPEVDVRRPPGPLMPPSNGNTAQGGVFVNTGADDCPNATVIPVAVGPVGSPNTVTILGDNSAASGSDCLLNPADVGWWEAFQIDAFADVTIDFCGTDPVRRPDWNVVYSVCGCVDRYVADSFNRTTTCPFNISFTFLALPPGTYYYPVFTVPGDKRCEDSGNPCNDSDECGAGYTCQDNLHPYTMHITAEEAVGSCCSLGGSGQCVSSGVCQGGFNAGGSCIDNADCPGGGTCTGISNSCVGGPNDGQPCSTDDDCTQPPSCVGEVPAEDCPAPDLWRPGFSCCETECRDLPPVGPEFVSENVTLLSRTPLSAFPDDQDLGAAITHYVSPGGQEYAIMTFNKGTGFVRVTNPASPVIVGYVDGEGIVGIHREAQAYNGYAYIVTDDGPGVGLQVVDLSLIDSSPSVVTRVNTTQLGVGFITAHTLFINHDSGILYLNSANHTGRDGLVALDLNVDPVEPPIVGTWLDPNPNVQCHDSTVLSYTAGPYAGREIAFCFAEDDGLKIVDVTNKSNMFTLSQVLYPNTSYCHQGWPTEDRRFLFINDEGDEDSGAVPQTTSYIVNIEDLLNPYFLTSFSNGLCAIDHNEMVRGGFLFEANYTTGLRIFNICDIFNVHEVGYFDTFPENNATDYYGLWGVDTRLPSGVVIASDLQRGLFVFDVSAAAPVEDADEDGVVDACEADCNRICVGGDNNGLPCGGTPDCSGGTCVCTRLFVDADAAGANDGSSWDDAYNHLQWALADAGLFPVMTEIWVAAGTYTPAQFPCRTDADCDAAAGVTCHGGPGLCLGESAEDHRARSFRLLSGVSLYGGFKGNHCVGGAADGAFCQVHADCDSAICAPGELTPAQRGPRSPANETILSGDRAGDDVPAEFPNGPSFAENSFNVLIGSGTTSSAVLDNFTIEGGNANGVADREVNGGGMYNDGGSPSIAGCVFRGNFAGYGGAIHNTNNGSPHIFNGAFEANQADNRGGAIHNIDGSSPNIESSSFFENESSVGGAMFNEFGAAPTVFGCYFQRNTALLFGGAMFNQFGASPTVNSSQFVENTAATLRGGAMFNSGTATPSIAYSSFYNNSAAQNGGAMVNEAGAVASVTASAFTGNSAGANGGAISSDADSVTNLSDCTFTGNSAVEAGGALALFASPAGVTVSRCTFDGNTTSAAVGAGGGGVAIGNAGGGRTIRFFHCRFTNNVSASQGGALTGGDAGSDLLLNNCLLDGNAANNGSGGAVSSSMNTSVYSSTVAGNTSSEGGAGLFVLVSPPATAFLLVFNSIFWNNADGVGGIDESDQLIADPLNTNLSFSLVQGLTGDYNGGGNIDADPLFLNPVGGDYRLLSGSPAIDAGDSSQVLPLAPPEFLDLAGGLRILDDPATPDTGSGGGPPPYPPNLVVDMGAYEYPPDCNFNGDPDECDVDCNALFGLCMTRPFCGTSADADMDNVPDECFTSTSGGSFTSAVPDDGHVVLESTAAITAWTVDADKRISSLVMKTNTVLRVTGGHLSFKAPELVGTGNPDPFILHGTMEVGGAFTIGKPNELVGGDIPQPMIVSPGGVFSTVNPQPNDPPVTAELYAKTVVIKPGLVSAGLSGGRVELTQQMKLLVEWDLILEGGNPTPFAAASAASVAGISPPPKLTFFAVAAAATASPAAGTPPVTLSTLPVTLSTPPVTLSEAKGLVTASPIAGTPGTRIDVRGSIRIVEAAEWAGDGEVLLGGDFDNRTTYPSLVDLSLSNMVLDGTVTHTFEVGGLDLGAVEEGFATDRDTLFDSAPHKNYSIGHLKVSIVASAGAASDWAASPLVRLDPIVVFTNRFANTAGAGPCQEALYVDTLEVEPDTKVALDNVRIYYRTLIAPGVSFERIGCGDVVQIVIGPIADPTGIDKPRFISFSVPGGGETALRVNLTTLHDVVPPYTAGASIPFTLFEGQTQYVGPPVQYVESVSDGTLFYASKLQCDPYYQD